MVVRRFSKPVIGVRFPATAFERKGTMSNKSNEVRKLANAKRRFAHAKRLKEAAGGLMRLMNPRGRGLRLQADQYFNSKQGRRDIRRIDDSESAVIRAHGLEWANPKALAFWTPGMQRIADDFISGR